MATVEEFNSPPRGEQTPLDWASEPRPGLGADCYPPEDLDEEGDKKKTKKKKTRPGKTAAKRGPTALLATRASGFEEYFADPPMTPQEAEDEREIIYTDEIPFEDRIQACIQRFRARRRLRGDLTRYFEEYLFLGGIDAAHAPFSGQDSKERVDVADAIGDPGERFYNGDTDHWSVDFTAVASGFFCSMGPITGFHADAENAAISVVENFLRYVVYHDVCPEHDADLKSALQVCAHAREELPMILRMQGALPGKFNLAAAELFGVHNDQDDWSFFESEKTADPKFTLLASLALIDEPELFDQISQADSYRIANQFDGTFEVTSIQRPAAGIIKRFRSLTVSNAEDITLAPIGKVTLKPASIEDGWERHQEPNHLKGGSRITIYFDDAVLANMKVGMKMTLTLCEMHAGEGVALTFVKSLHEVVPTFHTFLPQELMRHFRAPRENERPAPSVHGRGGSRDDGDEDGH